jgi:hypothetical protein
MQNAKAEFWGFCSGVVKDSNLLWYDTATLSNHILTLSDSLQLGTMCLYIQSHLQLLLAFFLVMSLESYGTVLPWNVGIQFPSHGA